MQKLPLFLFLHAIALQEVKERQFLLFPDVLVLLSVSEKLSGYCYEVRPIVLLLRRV